METTRTRDELLALAMKKFGEDAACLADISGSELFTGSGLHQNLCDQLINETKTPTVASIIDAFLEAEAELTEGSPSLVEYLVTWLEILPDFRGHM